eukprot:CAMPEP_0113917174 /NCGR_PEP_ID=MMETSP0780_2-20120614/32571_1 /TAXON_ID=652834 /ORGANISM="Palpitomonas bilix" /LENGTH=356 /DNA_ID=CAMNT_0000916685 /DNA_START=79 /DNA_END=1149 /DNA_ORIENTATION=- /assembly_acc=CAM_ASM_000599
MTKSKFWAEYGEKNIPVVAEVEQSEVRERGKGGEGYFSRTQFTSFLPAFVQFATEQGNISAGLRNFNIIQNVHAGEEGVNLTFASILPSCKGGEKEGEMSQLTRDALANVCGDRLGWVTMRTMASIAKLGDSERGQLYSLLPSIPPFARARGGRGGGEVEERYSGGGAKEGENERELRLEKGFLDHLIVKEGIFSYPLTPYASIWGAPRRVRNRLPTLKGGWAEVCRGFGSVLVGLKGSVHMPHLDRGYYGWIYVVFGWKRIAVWPEEEGEAVCEKRGCVDPFQPGSDLDTSEDAREEWRNMPDQCSAHNGTGIAPPVIVDVKAGELFFLPVGWAHGVYHEEDTLALFSLIQKGET